MTLIEALRLAIANQVPFGRNLEKTAWLSLDEHTFRLTKEDILADDWIVASQGTTMASANQRAKLAALIQKWIEEDSDDVRS